ncbi:BTAD domain-containing putative transcriptional regulator [Actinomycetospora lutea]|uniref:AfsR/SARP family transcriptional regulator n=1 Tax=Actinomycetospora lutea TaxID=663604 RepID=UPI0023661EFD|nr:BTAD domain-containing putative transcriptional regulator [Actinomycetospora lutea]MDD7939462.1 BTAD domain-containing putative transcriptional regulator [Actinomycetospora lutea]
MQFRVLGPLEVLTEAGPVVPGGPRSRALLTALLLTPGELVSTARLVEAVWGDAEPADPDNAVHRVVSRLRRVLGPGAASVVTRPPGYLLHVDRRDIDAEAFAEEVRGAAARLASDPHGALAVLDTALIRWRGPAYGEFADSFARAAATRLEDLRIVAREHHVEALLRSGAAATAAATATDLIAEHPLRERPVELAVRALVGDGRVPEALSAYRRYRDHVRDELGLDPSPALRHLHAGVLRAELPDIAPTRGPAAVPAPRPAPERSIPSVGVPVPARTGPRLPPRPPTALLGRDDVLTHLGDVLTARSLVTIVGPGGVGKTRVALELAHRASAAGRAVWWVDLVPVTEGRLLEAVATATGVELGDEDPAEDLAHALAAHRGVLVVDNAEHLLDALAALVERVLIQQRGLTVLATSRERLGVDEEAVQALPPLLVPTDADEANPAVRLFLDRMPTRTSGALDAEQIGLVARVCRELDGLPLAIELGAARADALGLPLLLERLGDRLDLLAGGRRTAGQRHRTLRAVVEWSHQLLTAEEAALFARLAIFPGSFGLDQVETVCADDRLPEPMIAPLLARLVEQSLVRRVRNRFGLLETLRLHAGERLEATGEHRRWASRHARDTAHRLEIHVAVLWSADEPGAVRALTELLDDLHAAWSHACGQDRRLAVRMAADIHDFAYGRQRLDLLRWGLVVAEWEGDPAGAGISDAAPDDLARALATAATVAWSSGRRDEAATLAARAIERAGGPSAPAAMQARRVDAHLAMFSGRAAEAAASYRELATSSHAAGDDVRAMVFELCRAQALCYEGRTDEAAAVIERLRDTVSATHHPTTLAWAATVEGIVLEGTDPDRALERYAAAIEHGAVADCRLFVTLARSASAALRARTTRSTAALPELADALDAWAQLNNEFMQWWVLTHVVAVLADVGRAREAAALGVLVAGAGDRRPHVGAEERRLSTVMDPAAMRPDAATASAARASALTEAVALARRALESIGDERRRGGHSSVSSPAPRVDAPFSTSDRGRS